MKIRFYATAYGRSPVEDFISGLPVRLKAAIFVALDEIREAGLAATGVSFRQVEGKLWELRIQAGAAARLFYVVMSDARRTESKGRGSVRLSIAQDPELIVLHGYLKQSQKAPTRELEVARRRLKEVLE